MKNCGINLTKKQANLAIGLCIDNSTSFIDDANILFEKNKLNHIIIPIEFAIEELGKAKIILDKIKTTDSDTITLDKQDGWLNHRSKVDVALELIDIPVGYKQLLGLVFGDGPEDYLLDPLAMAAIEDEVKTLKEKTKKGHDLRLESSFVDFDNETFDPKLSRGMTKDEAEMFLRSMDDAISRFRIKYTRID